MGTHVPRRPASIRKSSVSVCVLSALATLPLCSFAAGAADTSGSSEPGTSALQEIVVTGSLIPQSQVELATPVTVITEEDIQKKGFADVAEALQRSAFATGAVENGQFAGFTQAAKVVSFFGLDASFTKYLIDGRPISQYPALYNGTENFVSITGIPTVLVDHVDMLPGAQSTIYGSDAIAGVVNVVMKKTFDGPVVDVRYGWTADGGGGDRRIAIGDGFAAGPVNVVVGGQYDKTTPIWGYQRPLTSQYYTQGASPQVPERDYLVYDLNDSYFNYDPANCANLSGLFNGSVALYTRPEHGSYCGTAKSGFYTAQNGDEQTQGYLHGSYDINDHAQVFVETLINHDVSRFNVGPQEYDSSFDTTSPYSYFEDPVNNPGDYLNVRHVFAPEEEGGLTNNMNKNTNNSVRGTFGVQGQLWAPTWKYLADFTWTVNKLTESTPVLLAPQLESYFGSTVFGPSVGFDSGLEAYEYEPNYANLYQPVSPATYRSFAGNLLSYSQTEESFARAQINTTDLFTLPGGNAGLALQVEAGDEGWFYNPDPDYFNGVAFGYTATAGSGHRSRYAGTSELKLPVLSILTLNLSGRYDDYRLSGQNVDKFTYNLGFELQAIPQFLFRGRYGTAFKAPTLADEFQGPSGAYQGVTDYYTCAQLGFTGNNIGNCPYFLQSDFVLTSGNTKLHPITADVWDLGWVATPIHRLTFTADFIHWAITNEVEAQNANDLVETDSSCLLGTLNISSPSCVAALAQVVRNSSGQIVSISTPKENVAQENLGVLIMELDYKFPVASIGTFDLVGSYSNTMSHNFQQYPGDPIYNLLNNPFYENIAPEFKTKDNVSVTWDKDAISATIYVERYGKTPNDVAYTNTTGYATPGAGDVGAWTLANASVSYKPIQTVTVTLAVSNLFNSGPPADHSTPGYSNQPYSPFNYNVYGRQYYLSARYGIEPN